VTRREKKAQSGSQREGTTKEGTVRVVQGVDPRQGREGLRSLAIREGESRGGQECGVHSVRLANTPLKRVEGGGRRGRRWG